MIAHPGVDFVPVHHGHHDILAVEERIHGLDDCNSFVRHLELVKAFRRLHPVLGTPVCEGHAVN
jgi:hypothetical protein